MCDIFYIRLIFIFKWFYIAIAIKRCHGVKTTFSLEHLYFFLIWPCNQIITKDAYFISTCKLIINLPDSVFPGPVTLKTRQLRRRPRPRPRRYCCCSWTVSGSSRSSSRQTSSSLRRTSRLYGTVHITISLILSCSTAPEIVSSLWLG